MKTVIINRAYMTSTRLPGKMMKAGKTNGEKRIKVKPNGIILNNQI
jgi:hypothetical protein